MSEPELYLYRLPDGSGDTPDADGRHTKAGTRLHSAAEYRRFPGCRECRHIAWHEAHQALPAGHDAADCPWCSHLTDCPSCGRKHLDDGDGCPFTPC
jgi:hypothetical protein